jgi:hypothetical protein
LYEDLPYVTFTDAVCPVPFREPKLPPWSVPPFGLNVSVYFPGVFARHCAYSVTFPV